MIDKYTARRIAEAINCWNGKRLEIITPEKVLDLQPIRAYEPNGLVVYPYQWGDVTILVWLHIDGSLTTKVVCW